MAEPTKTPFLDKGTTVSKTAKTAVWTISSLIIVAILSAIVANPAVFTAIGWGSAVVIANILLVFIKNLLDTDVKNI